MFFKTVSKLKSDNRGLTLTELMVVLVILGLIGSTIVLIAGNIWRRYRLVENRYIVQTEVKAIADAFTADASTGSIATATNVDLMREDLDALKTNKQFTSCPELGSFTENEETHALTFAVRNKDYINSLKLSTSLTATQQKHLEAYKYTYLFVYDKHFYVLNGEEDVAYRFSYTDEVEIDINYSVSVDAFRQVYDAATKKYVEATTVEGLAHNYINAVTVSIASNPEKYTFKYELLTSFSLKNVQGNNLVNMNSADGMKLTNQYIAGYTYGELENYPKGDYLESGVTYPSLSQAATVIRYISITKFGTGSASSTSGSAGSGFTCSTTFLMVGSNVGEGVKNTLRDFRDNTLRGNALGEFIIEKYYAWSPKAIDIFSEHRFLRDISAKLVTDTAYLIEMTKA